MTSPRPRRPVLYANGHLLWLVIAILLLGGLLALGALPKLEDPRITQRFPLVFTPYPGASAEQVEAQVTDPIEEKLQEIEEIKEIESTSRAGISFVQIELQASVTPETNEAIFSQIREKLDEASGEFPAGVRKPLFDDKRAAVAFSYIATVEWTGDGDPPVGIMARRAEILADRLRRIPGTEIVRLYGAPVEEITVTPRPDELAALGMTAAQFATTLTAADTKRSAGTVRTGAEDLAVEVDGAFEALDRVGAVALKSDAEGRTIRVRDIAETSKEWRLPPPALARSDGNRAVFVAARMAAGERIGAWAESAKTITAEFAEERQGEIVVRELFDQSRYTNDRLNDLAINLVLGALVIMMVVLAVMGWRSALIVSTALPLTGAGVLVAMMVLGGSLHQMSIFGMIIGLGLLIDNAIVVVDETNANLARGLERQQAMRATLSHLRMPLFASTLTTILAFAPISLLPGSTGDFVGWIGTSVILAVGLSYALAITVIAALAARFAKGRASGEGDRILEAGYRNRELAKRFLSSVRLAVRRPWLAILVSFSLPFIGFVSVAFLGSQFFPPVDRDMFDVKVSIEPSASLEKTDTLSRRIEESLRAEPGVEEVHWLVGGSFPSVFYNLVMTQDNASHYAQALVETSGPDATLELVRRLERELPLEFPSAQIVVSQFKQGPPTEAAVQYKVTGPSIAELQRIGERIRLELMRHPDVLATEVTMPRGEPRLTVDLREEEARAVGLDGSAIAAQIRGGLDGETGGILMEDLEQLPVRVRLDEAHRSAPSDVWARTLVTPTGAFLPLDAVAETRLTPAAGGITRLDGERVNVVKAYTRNDALPIDISQQILENLEEQGFSLPAGYRIALGGEAEQDAQAQGNLGTYAPLLVTAMLATLVLTFRSVALAGVLLVVAIMSVGNAMLATWIAGFPISFNTILGTIGLIGLAFNNAIVVIAAIRKSDAARTGDPGAIAEQVSECGRHILSTTLTTAGGFLPLLILIGGSFWPSLAIVLAGGVIGSMILSLYFVPSAFGVISRRRERNRGSQKAIDFDWRRLGTRDATS
ncbi:efflux RND transporter permease subunit [Qipengyuania sp.]|uniref:efflux RND transporter permease subunit n=1 Tax=Qipengyuania sp. TaxID=2004515 RepID=UPI003BA9DE16